MKRFKSKHRQTYSGKLSWVGNDREIILKHFYKLLDPNDLKKTEINKPEQPLLF